ncbi:MAG TPA: hypothetical protein VMM92_08835 [Thermoanaerobaculia bacterium]|nr:hypothetical protein [Thermoanaerobaculia bacterium]
MDKITSTLKALDDEAVASVYKAFSEVVDEENSRTSLLQQRASSLLSAAALVVSIIVTSIGLMFKDGRKYLRENDLRILSGIVYSILFLFAISLYWTWEAFSTRPYMSFNVDSLVSSCPEMAIFPRGVREH